MRQAQQISTLPRSYRHSRISGGGKTANVRKGGGPSWILRCASTSRIPVGVLRAEDAHAPWLDARPGSREGVERAAAAVQETLRDDAWERFAAAAEAIDRRWEETGIEPL